MNKTMTILILLVVLAAMSIVFYTSLEPMTGSDSPAVVMASVDNATVPAEAVPPAPVMVSTNGGRVDAPAQTSPQTPAPTASPVVTPLPRGTSAPEQPLTPVAPTPAPTVDVPRAPVIPPATTPPVVEVPRTPVAIPPATTAPATAPATPPAGNTAPATPPAVTSPETPAPVEQPVQPEPTKVVEKSLSLTGSHELVSIGLHFAGQQMKLRIVAKDDFPCKTFVLPSPDRLVVDLPGSWKGMKTPSVPANKIIKGARVGTQPAGPRLVLDLEKKLKEYKVERPEPNVVEIYLY